jgi:hypothetical protein
MLISQYSRCESRPNSSMTLLSFFCAVLLEAIIERMSFNTGPGARTLAAMYFSHSVSIVPSRMIRTGGKSIPSCQTSWAPGA